MAKTDGTRRIIVTGKVIILIGITLGVMTWVIVFNVPQLLTAEILIAVPALSVAALGGLVWGVGWILQGFNQPDR